LDRLKQKFAAIKPSLDALKEKPDDPEANLAVGKWYCLSKGDWDKGLPMLAKGSEAPWADLARRDVAAPTEAKAQLELADAWWEMSQKSSSVVKPAIESRAAHWYEEALPKLAGLDKTRVEKRLDSLAPAEAKVQPARGGVVQPGNVALAANGATVSGTATRLGDLIDGNSTKYDGSSGFAHAQIPSDWTIVLNKVYRLRQIRFLLWDQDDRYYQYKIAVSADGKKFEPLVDRSQGQWKSWQEIAFPSRPVKAIKLLGLHCSDKSGVFHVVEVEAYCVPPKQR
jgi:hypothetical protein